MFHEMFRTAEIWQKAALAGAQTMIAAGTVMQIRMMQMGLGTMKPEEASRMILEKPVAFARSAQESTSALMRNQGLAAAALAGVRPIGTTTRANARRLSRASKR